MQSITIKFKEADLSPLGRKLLNTIRGQNEWLASLLQPQNGIIYANIWDNDELGYDDTVFIKVRSTISRSERMRKYGVSGLDYDFTAKDENGRPILINATEHAYLPTEDYINRIIEKMWDGNDGLEQRRYEVNMKIVKQYHDGKISAIQVWEKIGQEFEYYCTYGNFEPVISSDWITQSEAATLAGVSLPAIHNATKDNRLPSWHDLREPNPQRQKRVSKKAVAKIWPPQSAIKKPQS